MGRILRQAGAVGVGAMGLAGAAVYLVIFDDFILKIATALL